MFRTLRTIFEQQISAFSDEPKARHSLEIASAALLFEISRADHDVSAIERKAIGAAVQGVFHLSNDEIDDLISSAEDAVDSSISIYDFTSIVNDRFTRVQKIELIQLLWTVAYADNHLDHYEEYYVRKIADLLHISHSDYIRTKHLAASCD